jgi:hypothetical protein
VTHRRVAVAGHLQQVGADCVQAVVAGERLVDRLEQREARVRPSAIAAATARLSVTIGLPVICSSSP